ncbi:MAG: hypothetical protein AVW06_02920 [Hadesarchaea archaeon DG-33-1]|nr:MAG: hypothetical protein AVW06_02920 [Hadesarchaea archaeon DG-33-1]
MEIQMKPYPPKRLTVYRSIRGFFGPDVAPNFKGYEMIISQATKQDIPMILDALKTFTTQEKDYYDLVTSRFYSELVAWKYGVLKNHYCLIAKIGGVEGKYADMLLGLANGRMQDEKTGISYHTVALVRGLRVGGHLFAAKMEYHFDILGQKEVLLTAETPIGFRRFFEAWRLEKCPGHHEVGAGELYKLPREHYNLVKTSRVLGERI